MTKQLHDETKPVPLMVRLPPDLHAAVRKLSEDERRSLNSQFIILVEIALQQLGRFPTTHQEPDHA